MEMMVVGVAGTMAAVDGGEAMTGEAAVVVAEEEFDFKF